MKRLIPDVVVMLAVGLVIAALFGGCSAVPAEFVTAERATYDAIADDYLAYVEADVTLPDQRKQDRALLVQTWLGRIVEAEEALKR